MSSITVKEILEVHANVQTMQKELASQAELIRRKDRDIELLRWKLRGAEEMCLLARYSELAFQTFSESTMFLNRCRISLGNHFLALTHASSQSSIDSLRGEIKMYRDSVHGGDQRVATLTESNEALGSHLTEAQSEVLRLKKRVAELEKEVATGKLSSFYEEEIASRETLIESLRLHNSQLMGVLKQPAETADMKAVEGHVGKVLGTSLVASATTSDRNASGRVPSLSATKYTSSNAGYLPSQSSPAAPGRRGAQRGLNNNSPVQRRPVNDLQGAWSSTRLH